MCTATICYKLVQLNLYGTDIKYRPTRIYKWEASRADRAIIM